jgi:hypothetical protein
MHDHWPKVLGFQQVSSGLCIWTPVPAEFGVSRVSDARVVGKRYGHGLVGDNRILSLKEIGGAW